MKVSSIAPHILVAAVACDQVSAFTPSFDAKSVDRTISRSTRLYSEIPREMAQMGFLHEDPNVKRKKRDQSSLLSAVAIDMPSISWDTSDSSEDEPLWSRIQLILSTALLITGNTVGASCLVLPEMAAKPGMTASTALFFGTYHSTRSDCFLKCVFFVVLILTLAPLFYLYRVISCKSHFGLDYCRGCNQAAR